MELMKFHIRLITFCVFVIFLNITLNAADNHQLYTFSGVVYALDLDKRTGTVVKLKDSEATSISIPEILPVSHTNGDTFTYKITDIAGAFRNNSKIKTVDLPSSIVTFAQGAFENCYSLTEITFPAGLSEIPNNTFLNCISLTDIHIPPTITRIEKDAFKGCSHLTSVTFEDSSTQLEIGSGFFSTFSDCAIEHMYIGRNISFHSPMDQSNSTLKSVIFGGSANKLPEWGAFMGCSELSDITLNENIKSIPPHSFNGCSSLENIELPQSIKRIEHNAFKDCFKLKSINLHRGIEHIGGYAFSNCKSIESIKFPNTLTKLDEYVFSDCSFLKSVDFGYRLEYIPPSAFLNCIRLESISIPSQISTIKDSAFKGCHALNSVSFPSNIHTIGTHAFENCESIESIEILHNPSSNTITIGKSAFRGCTSLEKITFQDYVKVSENAFSDCQRLSTVTFNGGANFGSSLIFENSPIETVDYSRNFYGSPYGGNESQQYLPFKNIATIKNIRIDPTHGNIGVRKDEFAASSHSLASLIITGRTGICDSFSADSLYLGGDVYYMDEDGYPSDDNPFGIGQFKKITLNGGSIKIPENAFCGSQIEYITIHRNSVVGKKAFKDCSNLKGLTLKGDKITLEEQCFAGCPLEYIIHDMEYDGKEHENIATLEYADSFDPEVYASASLYVESEYINDVNAKESGWNRFQNVYQIPYLDAMELLYSNIPGLSGIPKEYRLSVTIGETIDLKQYLEDNLPQLSNLPGLFYYFPDDEGLIDKTCFASSTSGKISVSAEIFLINKSTPIKIKSYYGSFGRTLPINLFVVTVPVTSISIPSRIIGTIGGGKDLNAIFSPKDATYQDVIWSSANPDIADVSEWGSVSFKSKGKTIITASYAGGHGIVATCEVEVYEHIVPVSQITLAPSTITGKVGETYQLVANIKPDDATIKDITWSSDNSTVASVDQSGLITLLSKGNALIKASAGNATATCTVVVDDDSGITDVVIDPDADVKIYTTQGMLIYEGRYSESQLTSGIYVIIYGNHRIKRIIQ